MLLLDIEDVLFFTQFAFLFLLFWRIVLAVLIADQEVKPLDDVPVLAEHILVVVPAVLSLLACLLTEVLIQVYSETIPKIRHSL